VGAGDVEVLGTVELDATGRAVVGGSLVANESVVAAVVATTDDSSVAAESLDASSPHADTTTTPTTTNAVHTILGRIFTSPSSSPRVSVRAAALSAVPNRSNLESV
jgi:hypothetical protein